LPKFATVASIDDIFDRGARLEELLLPKRKIQLKENDTSQLQFFWGVIQRIGR